MRNMILLKIFLISCFLSQAQYSGYKPLADAAYFNSAFAAASNKISTIKSDFVQEKELGMLSEKIISKGKFWFKRENAVRMEYTKPFTYLMVINGSKIFLKDSQKENKVSAKSNKLFKQINRIMVDCINGTALSNPDFAVRVFEGAHSYLAELSPVNKNLKSFFKNINLIIAKKDYSVTDIQMHEPGGDKTIIQFSNREQNVNLSDALFAVNQ